MKSRRLRRLKSLRLKSRRQRKQRKQNKKTRKQRKRNTRRFFLQGGADSSVSSDIVFMPRGPGCPRSPMSKEQAAKLSEGDASEC